MAASASSDDVTIIKKYANRRLYNTGSSSYITLEHLADMVREKREFKVIDAKSNEDITHNVLTQIIMEEESRGQTMLPVNFLRQLIALYGDSMQAMVPGYLEASMDSFRRNQDQFKAAVEGAFAKTPFADLAKRNMAFYEAATAAFKPGAGLGTTVTEGPAAAPEPESKGDDVAALKAELAALQDKIEKLAK